MKKELEELKENIRKSLLDGNAVYALDRLHTFTVKKIRSYCLIHGIDILNDKGEGYPLPSLVGMLIKSYTQENKISDFSKISLKQSISVFDQFNDVRNKNSLAHDNTLLTNEESLYVVNCVINIKLSIKIFIILLMIFTYLLSKCSFSLKSSKSLITSPSKLNKTTTINMAIPGAITVQGAN